MGCNCGKKKKEFKELVKQASVQMNMVPAALGIPPTQPVPLIPKPDPKELMKERILRRNERIRKRIEKQKRAQEMAAKVAQQPQAPKI